MNKCPVFMKKVVYEIFGIEVDPDNVDILYQNYDAATGITDIEMTDRSNNEQKHLLEELKEYLGGIMTMQTKDSNWVYVVILSGGKPDECDLTWIEIVKNHNKYLHPLGGNGWPKEPPNYIAFRYGGNEMPDVTEDNNYFVYKLGPAIIPVRK